MLPYVNWITQVSFHLAILKNTGGSQAEKFKKKFQNLSKEKDLDIAVQCNLKIIISI